MCADLRPSVGLENLIGTTLMFADQLPHTAQMILGLDRESPIFTVYADDEEQLHVYDGFERLEVVWADRQAPNFNPFAERWVRSAR